MLLTKDLVYLTVMFVIMLATMASFTGLIVRTIGEYTEYILDVMLIHHDSILAAMIEDSEDGRDENSNGDN